MAPTAENPLRNDLGQPVRAEGNRWILALFRPVDIAFLVFFRIVFAVTMLWHIWLLASTGSIKYYYIDPPFHFTFYGFDWVRPWPGDGMYLHFAGMAVLAFCILIGLFYRISIFLFCLGFTYEFLLEKALYQNHYYLLCLVSMLMIFLPAHRAFSLDVLRRPQLRSNVVPTWMLWLLRAQLGIAYFYGGLAKLNADWLRGQPMRMGLAERAHFPFVGQFFNEDWMVLFFAHGGLWFDLLIVPALLWRRTRTTAYVCALTFHLINSQMWNIGVFPWFMIFATLMFFPPGWPRRLFTMHGLRPLSTPADDRSLSADDRPLRRSQKITVTFLAAYLAIQFLVPFRHYLYPGNVSWTEEGHRFAWHMMLRGKTCAVRFYATDPKTGRTGSVSVRGYLNHRQVIKVGKEPDMLVQFSHYLAEQLRIKGYGDVEIRALVLVSLNGRKPQLLIDPNVNLAAEPRTWRRYPWIMPLKEPLRKQAWTVPLLEWEQRVTFDVPAFMKTPKNATQNQTPR
ncbi:MAG: HTTM domain-containing protein [Planctomycetes bacterium]|nr:HTTM domain-containing protein [Planctomycetota bacterium]